MNKYELSHVHSYSCCCFVVVIVDAENERGNESLIKLSSRVHLFHNVIGRHFTRRCCVVAIACCTQCGGWRIRVHSRRRVRGISADSSHGGGGGCQCCCRFGWCAERACAIGSALQFACLAALLTLQHHLTQLIDLRFHFRILHVGYAFVAHLFDFAFARFRVAAVPAIADDALIGDACVAAGDAGSAVFAAGVNAATGCCCSFSASVVDVAFTISARGAAAVLLLRLEAFHTRLRVLVMVVVVLQGELLAAYAVDGGAIAARSAA